MEEGDLLLGILSNKKNNIIRKIPRSIYLRNGSPAGKITQEYLSMFPWCEDIQEWAFKQS